VAASGIRPTDGAGAGVGAGFGAAATGAGAAAGFAPVVVGAGTAGSFVFSGKVKSNTRVLSVGANCTLSFTFRGSFAPVIGVSSALVARPALSGYDASSFSLESSTLTLPVNPFTGIGRVKSS